MSTRAGWPRRLQLPRKGGNSSKSVSSSASRAQLRGNCLILRQIRRFFSHASDPVPEHSGAVSRRNPVGSIRGELCDRRISCPGTFARGLAGAARSNSPQNNRVPLASVSGSFATTPSIPRSTQEAVPRVVHHAAPQGPTIPGSVQSSGRCSAGLHAACGKFPSPTCRARIPTRRASFDTSEHPGSFSAASPTDDAGERINEVLSWK